MERAGLSSNGQELLSIWNQMDNGSMKQEQAFDEADKAVRRRNQALEKNE
jgi:hypothetical protein